MGLYRAYVWPFLKSNKWYILGYRSRYSFLSLANTISGQAALVSCQYQNALQVNHYDNNLSPWNEWFLERMRVLDSRILLRRLFSFLEGLQSLWLPLFPRCFSVAYKVIVLYDVGNIKTQLDLTSSYHRIKIKEDDKLKTAFQTWCHYFEY